MVAAILMQPRGLIGIYDRLRCRRTILKVSS